MIEEKKEDLLSAEPVKVLAGPIEGSAVNNSDWSLEGTSQACVCLARRKISWTLKSVRKR